MGLLKHAILPFFVLVDALLVVKCLLSESMTDDLFGPDGAFQRDMNKNPITPLELHGLHCVGGTCLLLGINNIAAIAVENAHYRGMALFLQTLFFAVDGYSYWKLGMDIPAILYPLVGVGSVGLVVHSMEPGIFTKDKMKKKSG